MGIGGVGMSGIAEVLHNLGYKVEGSDLRDSETTRRLEQLGIKIHLGHREDNVKTTDVVVISSAVAADNPEVLMAGKLSIPVIPRAEMLAELARLKYGVLIAGAHGKTTTTSLVASILGEAMLDPTVVIGGKLKGMGSNARMGEGEFMVAEADESDGSFLKLTPTIAVVTNIDKEHMDYFKSMDEIRGAFVSFINKVPFYGLAILCGDNKYIQDILPEVRRRFITYGVGEGHDLIASEIVIGNTMTRFEVLLNGTSLGLFEVPLPGRHNVCNCLAAIAVANELKVDINIIRQALKNFSGVQRRFEFKGSIAGIDVIDDYAHHPSEIMATLKAMKEAMDNDNVIKGKGGRLVAVFQPHRYTRTRDLLEEFIDAFVDVDKLLLLDIYPAGEKPLPGVNSELLCQGITETGKDVMYFRDRGELISQLGIELREGDRLLTLGAGDVWKLGEEFLQAGDGQVLN